ncbi:MAG TPA: DUF4157 domain-containing protein [Kofleriaceae bacterium]
MSEHQAKQPAPAQATNTAAVSAVDSALGSRSGVAHGDAQVHDDPTSHAAADALGAKAFTAGSQVFFGAGQAGGAGGDELLRHELTHVDQMRGVTAPQPGNFRVSDPSGAQEGAARAGASGATGEAHTIYRDPTGGPAPAAGGAGPAATPTATPTPTPAPTPAADPYDTWKAAVNAFDRAAATTQWGALPSDKKSKVASEAQAFLERVIRVMQKDSPDVIKTAGVKIDDYVYTVFHTAEFVQMLPTMRAAGLLTPFINAQPLKGATPANIVTIFKGWVDTAMNVGEARAMFQKIYPNVYDTATPGLAFSAVPLAWSLAQIQRLYGILSSHLPVGHAQTLTGGFLIQNSQGFGWYEPANFRVALPGHAGSSSAAGDLAGHDMTGGAGSGTTGAYTKKDGTAGAQTTLGHYEGTALHEVGHGVGDRMGGNAYAQNPASYPGWTPLTPDQWGADLWTAPTGPVDNSVPKTAQLDDGNARKMFLHEIQNGAGTYKYDPGWFKSAPSNADLQKWVKSRYANVPLYKWWDYLVVQGNSKDNSYNWNAPDARIRADWTYGYLTRAGNPFIKLKTEAFNNRVSWYGVSSPLEWFAEQYTHYYRTEKTGGGLIDPATKSLLDSLDTKSFAPTNSTGTTGVVYGGQDATGGPGASAKGGSDGTGAAGRATGGAQPAAQPQTEPLFFPW